MPPKQPRKQPRKRPGKQPLRRPRKRPEQHQKQPAAEDSCSFTIRAGKEANGKIYRQKSPFTLGKSKRLDIQYSVEPEAKWEKMTRYNSFVLERVKFTLQEFVDIASPKEGENWVAYILEIRASDEHHVYARIFWMYWPYELPAGTMCGNQPICGAQAYHGKHELIASNHMAIIDVRTVIRKACVNQWDGAVQTALYWRQALDIRDLWLSTVENICKCDQPENPDKTLVQCDKCRTWLHEDCLIHRALMQTNCELGDDIPTSQTTLKGSLVTDSDPARIEIIDLRKNVQGGLNLWRKPLECLACQAIID